MREQAIGGAVPGVRLAVEADHRGGLHGGELLPEADAKGDDMKHRIDSVVCPYCKKDVSMKGLEPQGDYVTHEIECGECGELFTVQSTVQVSYHARCNEENHDFRFYMDRFLECKRCGTMRVKEAKTKGST